MKLKRKKGYFSISAVAKMFSVHQQTIRLYEKQGLINPERSEGGTRLFAEEDIDKLEEIIYLTHELGINLAGVEMILKLKKQLSKMQKEMNRIFDDTQQQLDQEAQASKEIVQISKQRLVKLKSEQLPLHPSDNPTVVESPITKSSIEVGNWEIEYDE